MSISNLRLGKRDMFSIAGFKPGPCFSEYDHTNKSSCLQTLELHGAPRQAKQTPISHPTVYVLSREVAYILLFEHAQAQTRGGFDVWTFTERRDWRRCRRHGGAVLGQVVRGTKEMANRPL